MKKIYKIIILIVIIVVIGYVTFFISNTKHYGYKIDMKNYETYLWIFTDSVKNSIDTNFFVGALRETDVLYCYNINNCQFYIWDIKTLKGLDLSDIFIIEKSKLDTIKFRSYEVLNKDHYPEITVKFDRFFENSLNIYLDAYSTINEYLINEKSNYKGFIGSIHKVSLSDDKRSLVTIDYHDEIRNCACIFYIDNQSRFYFILITSKNPINKDIINGLNLN